MIDPNALLELTALNQRYAFAVDSKDWKLLESCFDEEVVVVDYKGGETRGPAGVVEAFRPMLEPFPRTHHLFATPYIEELDGDRARGHVHAIGTHVLPGAPGGDVSHVGVWYHDEYVRRADGWKIARRHVDPVWMGGNPEMLT
jgi:ketosteroid isomerase-like protein